MMVTHQVSARQSKTKQSSTRTKAAPQRPKKKGHPNLPGKLVSHRSHKQLALESNRKTEAAINTIPPLRTKDGEWAKSDAQKANILADHFASVFKL
jgi:hypothetical protein